MSDMPGENAMLTVTPATETLPQIGFNRAMELERQGASATLGYFGGFGTLMEIPLRSSSNGRSSIGAALRDFGIEYRLLQSPREGLSFRIDTQLDAVTFALGCGRGAHVFPRGEQLLFRLHGLERVPPPTLQSIRRVATCLQQRMASKCKIENGDAPFSKGNHGKTSSLHSGFMPALCSEEEVQRRLDGLPATLRASLMPFQSEGVVFGLERGGRVLIADEMGVGKTLQALALAECYSKEWPLLILVPASLRTQWAEEVERWLPHIRPADIRVIATQADRLGVSTRRIGEASKSMNQCEARPPRVVITSYHMLSILHKEFALVHFKVVVVDESHAFCSEATHMQRCGEIVKAADRVVLLSGTPNIRRPLDMFRQVDLLRPGILGKDKKEFSRRYCPQLLGGGMGLRRIAELRLLLTQCVMIRRLKCDIGLQLPPLRRQIVRVDVPGVDRLRGEAMWRFLLVDMKIAPVVEWLSEQLANSDTIKFLIFGHHRKMLNAIQDQILEKKGISFIRIDGNTPTEVRSSLVREFRDQCECRVALLSITAAGIGLDFSAASVVVFCEMPPDVSVLRQAEDRAHRRGQSKPVNVYYLCAALSQEEVEWQRLSGSLELIEMVQDNRGGEGLECLQVLSKEQGLGFREPLSSRDNVAVVSPVKRSDDKASELHLQSMPQGRSRTLSPEELWIEVSRNTGRLHLHSADDGNSLLGINFLPAVVQESDDDYVLELPPILAQDPLCVRLVRDFSKEWNKLAPMKRCLLYGSQLRPGKMLVNAVAEAQLARMRCGEIEDGISEITTTRYNRNAHGGERPPNVEEREVFYRIPYVLDPCRAVQCFSVEGHRLCLWCQKPYNIVGGDSQGDSGPERILNARYELFCTPVCHEKHRERSSGNSIRLQLSRREHGVCQKCGCDCASLVRRLRGIDVADPSDTEALARRRHVVEELAPQFLLAGQSRKLYRLLFHPSEGHAWEADHDRPVHNGGGSCGLGNLVTLCVVCHGQKSALEAGERAKKRRINSSLAV